jgi:hypothetical protein
VSTRGYTARPEHAIQPSLAALSPPHYSPREQSPANHESIRSPISMMGPIPS